MTADPPRPVLDPARCTGCGDCVAVCLHQWGRWKGTGARVESRTWQVFTFRDGKVTRCRGYPTKAEALEAVGLRE